MTLADKIAELRELAERATPIGKAWIPRPCGMLPESMRDLGILSSHNRTPYIGVHDAEFISVARTYFPALLDALEAAVGALEWVKKDIAFAEREDPIVRACDEALAEMAKILQVSG